MREHLSIGPVPYNESCQQVGTRDYDGERARAEVTAFIKQLYRAFPQITELAGIRLHTHTEYGHDAGPYREACIVVDDDAPDALELAYEIERSHPGDWDDEARIELGLGVPAYA